MCQMRSRFTTTSDSKDEAFNRPLVTTFIVPKQHEYMQEIFVGTLHGNKTLNCDLEFWIKSGETCFLLVNTTTRRDPENNVIGVVGVPVTESNTNQLAVAAIANELRQLVLRSTSWGSIVFINKRFFRSFGPANRRWL